MFNASSADSSSPPSAQSFLQNPYYFMFASLAKPDEDVELHWLKVSCQSLQSVHTPPASACEVVREITLVHHSSVVLRLCGIHAPA